MQARTASFLSEARCRAQAALDWLCRSQDATKCNGSAAYYCPFWGWGAAYPETSGYIVPTLWRGGEFLNEPSYKVRALRMARWLLELQDTEGWFPAGTLRKKTPRSPSIFNTGQILFGLTEAARRTGDRAFTESARRAASWLVGKQDRDGRWRAHAYVAGYSPSYYAHVCWPLLEFWNTFGGDEIRSCAERGLQAIAADRRKNGTFTNWGFAASGKAFTHTIGYTLQGMIESALILDRWSPWGEAAEATSEALMRKYEVRHRLAGAYDKNWNPSSRFICLTGHCQLALTWLRIYALRDDARYLNAATKALLQVCQRQRLRRWPSDLLGAIPGSTPISGAYMRFRYPNWAAKFFADGMMEICRVFEELPRQTNSGVEKRDNANTFRIDHGQQDHLTHRLQTIRS